jgi:hypothetical protein
MRVNPNNLLTILVGATLNFGLTGVAQAELQGRDLDGDLTTAEAYYDTGLNITWLADASYDVNAGANGDGFLTLAEAQDWTASLSFTDGVHSYNNWRLPTNTPLNGVFYNYTTTGNGSTDFGYNISAPGTVFYGSTANEMAYLFHITLGNLGHCPVAPNSCTVGQPGAGLTNTGPFLDLAYIALNFDFGYGLQYATEAIAGRYAFAVSDGDVGIAVASVPEADTWTMLLAGLGLVGFMSKRRKQVEA